MSVFSRSCNGCRTHMSTGYELQLSTHSHVSQRSGNPTLSVYCFSCSRIATRSDPPALFLLNLSFCSPPLGNLTRLAYQNDLLFTMVVIIRIKARHGLECTFLHCFFDLPYLIERHQSPHTHPTSPYARVIYDSLCSL